MYFFNPEIMSQEYIKDIYSLTADQWQAMMAKHPDFMEYSIQDRIFIVESFIRHWNKTIVRRSVTEK